ncbi:hypothetical protein [Zavarzinia compransoris]|uniref:hypothetical protein n=1 Tax=Zavarzinia compransoris TaxID=1264899 RepID=UPI0010E1534C|nr:hypothetical protein [Zavarzinia compransoris]TDP44070.1 hypothetical protein DES42_108117 [Zavarzinia compransoris]
MNKAVGHRAAPSSKGRLHITQGASHPGEAVRLHTLWITKRTVQARQAIAASPERRSIMVEDLDDAVMQEMLDHVAARQR